MSSCAGTVSSIFRSGTFSVHLLPSNEADHNFCWLLPTSTSSRTRTCAPEGGETSICNQRLSTFRSPSNCLSKMPSWVNVWGSGNYPTSNRVAEAHSHRSSERLAHEITTSNNHRDLHSHRDRNRRLSGGAA